MNRIGRPALVFAPTITIREQWVARITEGFLCEGVVPEDYISQDLKNPRAFAQKIIDFADQQTNKRYLESSSLKTDRKYQ